MPPSVLAYLALLGILVASQRGLLTRAYVPEIYANGYPEDDDREALLPTRTNSEPMYEADDEDYTRPIVDPITSWHEFVSRSETSKKGKGKNKNKGRDKTLHGPPGPPGPRGPPGPPGAEITKEALMAEFKAMVKEAADRRAQKLLQDKRMIVNGSAYYENNDDIEIIPRIPSAFHCKLQNHIQIPKKSLVEIKNFLTPFPKGAFKRGNGLDMGTGRFTAFKTGIYQLSANIHISQKRGQKYKEDLEGLRTRDNVRVLICIESLCHRHTSLEFISGLESNSRVFTVNVNGLLQLEEGQYASVYIDNSSNRQITAQSGSDFTGIMLGV